MLFEDVHWADPTTLEVIDLLIHRVRNIPLLVVITHRPEFPSAGRTTATSGRCCLPSLRGSRAQRWFPGWPAVRRCPRTC